MSHPAEDKHEIIRLAEDSHLPVSQILARIGVSRTTFYRWYDRYERDGIDGLQDRCSGPGRVWNRIPDATRDELIELALDRPELSPCELATTFVNEKGYFVSESSVYRLLKAHDLITSPAFTVIKASDEFHEMYGTEVSASLISSVTDAVADEVKAWQARPLDAVYPIVYLDCIHTKVRDGAVRVKAIYIALGINMAGEKEPLGLWIAQTEGAKFWLQVVNELRNRGVQDIFVACVDGLKGFPEAIEAVFPKTAVQLCIVHMVRHSLNFVTWKRRKGGAADLKRIYQATTTDEAELRPCEFADRWDDDYLPIGQSWRRNWERIIPFFDFPPEIRKVVYATNAIESVNMSLRKITKNRGSFPSDEALLKLFYLALHNIAKSGPCPSTIGRLHSPSLRSASGTESLKLNH